MLSAAITALFTFAIVLAMVTIARSLAEARIAYARLMREGEVLRAGLALQASAGEMRLRAQAPTASRRVMAMRRPTGLRPLRPAVRACAVA